MFLFFVLVAIKVSLHSYDVNLFCRHGIGIPSETRARASISWRLTQESWENIFVGARGSTHRTFVDLVRAHRVVGGKRSLA